jgi:hypothetical protein
VSLQLDSDGRTRVGRIAVEQDYKSQNGLASISIDGGGPFRFQTLLIGEYEIDQRFNMANFSGRYRLDEVALGTEVLATKLQLVQERSPSATCVPVHLEPRSPFSDGGVKFITGLSSLAKVLADGGLLTLDPTCEDVGSASIQVDGSTLFYVRSPMNGTVVLRLDPPASYLAGNELAVTLTGSNSESRSLYSCGAIPDSPWSSAVILGLFLVWCERRGVKQI